MFPRRVGVKFYQSCGYTAAPPVSCNVGGVSLQFVPMRKVLPALPPTQPSRCILTEFSLWPATLKPNRS